MPLMVSNRQLDAITAVLEAQENEQLLDYAKQRFPDIVVPGSAECNVEWIRAVRVTARRFGIRHSKNLAVFVDLSIMYGSGFPDSEWAGETLRTRTFSEFEKINILKSKLEEQGIVI